MKKEKIFGIGLPKTGTWSLCLAMNQLGYKSLHYIDPSPFDFYVKKIKKYDFLNDCPINYIFDELPIVFPNSKYICSTREYSSWIKSCKRFFKKRKWKDNQEIHLKNLFEVDFFEEKKFKEAYEIHEEKVLNFSKKNKVLFLPLEISSSEKWNFICSFLEIKNKLKKEYPYINTSKIPLI